MVRKVRRDPGGGAEGGGAGEGAPGAEAGAALEQAAAPVSEERVYGRDYFGEDVRQLEDGTWVARDIDPTYPYEIETVPCATSEIALERLREARRAHVAIADTGETREVSKTSDGTWFGIYRDPRLGVRFEEQGADGETEADVARRLDARIAAHRAEVDAAPGEKVHPLDDPSTVEWAQKFAPQILNRRKVNGAWVWGEGHKLLRLP